MRRSRRYRPAQFPSHRSTDRSTGMSAFAAFRLTSASEMFSTEEEDSETIKYEIGSSDEEIDEKPRTQSDSTRSGVATPMPVLLAYRTAMVPEVFELSFVPDDDNLVTFDDHIIIGLKPNENILVSGQCKMTIQRGAVLMNEVDYHHADPDNPISIVAPTSQSIPIISSTQIVDRTGVRDTYNEHNQHLFSSDYKSVVMLSNYSTGVEDIGSYWRPFKRLFRTPGNDEVELLGEYERLFQSYTFEVILRNIGSVGMNLGPVWGKELQKVTQSMSEAPEASVTMIIGHKNSGKTTFSKALTNSVLLKQQLPVAYLDLDPGQSEFSPPYTLSLSLLERPTYGMYLFDPLRIVASHYYGFTTPQQHPELYTSITKALLHTFNSKIRSQGIHLVVNTPGWMKGFGVEILHDFAAELQPDNLVLLSGNLDPESPENSDVLACIACKSSIIVQGIYSLPRYSPSQLRTWHKLLYCHRQQKGNEPRFDFKAHILTRPPLRLPYQVEANPAFCGVNCVLFLNADVPQIGAENIMLLLDASMVGFYLVDDEYFSAHKVGILFGEDLPLVLSPSAYGEMIDHRAPQVVFAGLGMIHSISTKNHCFNVYIPDSVQQHLSERIRSGLKLVVVKGEGDLPPAEILMPELLRAQERRPKENTLPYVSFESSKVAGVWKTRRNVMRRGHRQ